MPITMTQQDGIAAGRHVPGHERGVRRRAMNNEPHGCMRDEPGRGDVEYLVPFQAVGAPVEGCEVSRPVSRAAALVFLAPVLCSDGRPLTGDTQSPLIVTVGVA